MRRRESSKSVALALALLVPAHLWSASIEHQDQAVRSGDLAVQLTLLDAYYPWEPPGPDWQPGPPPHTAYDTLGLLGFETQRVNLQKWRAARGDVLFVVWDAQVSLAGDNLRVALYLDASEHCAGGSETGSFLSEMLVLADLDRDGVFESRLVPDNLDAEIATTRAANSLPTGWVWNTGVPRGGFGSPGVFSGPLGEFSTNDPFFADGLPLDLRVVEALRVPSRWIAPTAEPPAQARFSSPRLFLLQIRDSAPAQDVQVPPACQMVPLG